jgi:hypothetical protein
MPPLIKTPPKTTIFSVDPNTGEPYMTVDIATKIINYHIWNYAAYLVNHDNLIEDICQEALVGACRANYKPELCAPKTFLTTVMNTTCERIVARYYRRKTSSSDKMDEDGNVQKTKGLRQGVMRNRAVVLQETLTTVDGGEISNLDRTPNNITALDYMLVQELVGDYDAELSKTGAKVPQGFKADRTCKRHLKPLAKSKCCSKCGKRYLRASGKFGVCMANYDGLMGHCKKCVLKVSKKFAKKRKKAYDLKAKSDKV